MYAKHIVEKRDPAAVPAVSPSRRDLLKVSAAGAFMLGVLPHAFAEEAPGGGKALGQTAGALLIRR